MISGNPHGEAVRSAARSMAGYRACLMALGRRCAGGSRASSISTPSSRSGRQPIMAFWHGRILPATYYFRQRGIVVITSQNFDGEWIAGIIERFGYGTARGSTSRGGAQGAAAAVRDLAAGKPRLHRGRSARPGAGGAARRGVAGRGDRPPGPAVSPRSRSTGRSTAGTARRFRSRSHRGARRGRAVRRAARCRRAGIEAAPAGTGEASARAGTARPRYDCSGAVLWQSLRPEAEAEPESP